MVVLGSGGEILVVAVINSGDGNCWYSCWCCVVIGVMAEFMVTVGCDGTDGDDEV